LIERFGGKATGGGRGYDRFMLRLHHRMKYDDVFQDGAAKRFW
jgi:hypothetical protein